MAWAALTAADLKTRLSGPETTALSSYALASGQTDPTSEVLSAVSEEVRGYIAANSSNTLGPAGTLPAQLKSAAIAIARWRLCGRLAIGRAGEMLQSESRRKEYEDAMSLLRDVAKGLFVVEAPATAGTETFGGADADYGSETQQDFSVI